MRREFLSHRCGYCGTLRRDRTVAAGIEIVAGEHGLMTGLIFATSRIPTDLRAKLTQAD